MGNGENVPYGIRLVRPAPALLPFVRYYAHRKARLVDTIAVHPVHARPAPLLIFECGDADSNLYIPSNGRPPIVSPRAVLVGIQTGPRGRLKMRGTVDSFSILLQPDGLDLLFGLPAQEFTDFNVNAECVFGRAISLFHERLAECRSFYERVSVANDFLIRRIQLQRVQDGISVAAHQILATAGGGQIAAMAERAGLSERQFRRKFLERVGVNPKLFARITRFEAALNWMARSSSGSWTEVAHRFGYYDQMHMVHECAQFTGETPTQTLQHFENAFGEQLAATRTDNAPHSDADRWIL